MNETSNALWAKRSNTLWAKFNIFEYTLERLDVTFEQLKYYLGRNKFLSQKTFCKGLIGTAGAIDEICPNKHFETEFMFFGTDFSVPKGQFCCSEIEMLKQKLLYWSNPSLHVTCKLFIFNQNLKVLFKLKTRQLSKGANPCIHPWQNRSILRKIRIASHNKLRGGPTTYMVCQTIAPLRIWFAFHSWNFCCNWWMSTTSTWMRHSILLG